MTNSCRLARSHVFRFTVGHTVIRRSTGNRTEERKTPKRLVLLAGNVNRTYMITNASESICLLAQAIKKRGESLCSLSELLLQVITWACCIETNASFSCAWIATESKTKQVAGNKTNKCYEVAT